MGDAQTMVRTEISLDGETYFLAQGQAPDEIQRRMEAAVQAGGKFVDFVVVRNRAVSVLVSPGVPIVFSVQTVQFDPRDTGDEETPFGGMFDLDGV